MAKKAPTDRVLNRCSDQSVFKNTGKTWEEWIRILEKAGAEAWIHRDIAAYLATKHKLTPWWRQIVAGGFEVAAGLRVEGRDSKGQYSITATKMTPFSAKRAWSLVASPEGLAIWLRPMGAFKLKPKTSFETEGGFFGEVRTMVAGARVRLSWRESDEGKPSTVQFNVFPKPKDRSMLVIQHDGLVDGRLREELRQRWKSALEGLLRLGSETKPVSQRAK